MALNYRENGGDSWVIGGNLTILPTAEVVGLENASAPSAERSVPCVEDSTATTVAAMRADFNNLLSALRDAGMLR